MTKNGLPSITKIFFLQPEKNIRRILETWNIDCDLTNVDFNSPSITTKNDSPLEPIEQLSKWKTSLNRSQIKNIFRVMNYFQLKTYSLDILPVVN